MTYLRFWIAGKRSVRWTRTLLVVIIALLLGASLVWAFAEEPLHFRDPYTGQTGDDWPEISTIHDDLTYALALAAGFSITDSITLQVWDQLVDSEQIGPGDAISYTNCTGGAFAPPPDPDEVCGFRPHSHQIWPMPDAMKDPDHCITSRFGPYSPFFHFPHDNARELGALHDWAWGQSDRLVAYEAYAWGAPAELTVMQASCRYTRTVPITTSVQPGSLPAFATYIHTLADYYSHRDCIAHMDALGMPWATHTLAGHPPCDYNPANPRPDDVHAREFYTYTDSQHTDAAIQHIYSELVARSQQGEGEYWPLDMETPITGLSGSPTLSETLSIFVHQWDFEHAAQRRAWLDQVVPAILAQRQPRQALYLPMMQLESSAAAPAAPSPAALQWGEPITANTPYTIYKADFLYGPSFLTTDIRVTDRESYENHALTIYRPADSHGLLENLPVVFVVHGGGWVSGYRDQYEFTAQSFTGVKGWITVVIDYRLTSDQVFIADQYCPDVDTCNRPENVEHRTKAAWYPDNLNDVGMALQWVMNHIAENGGDPDRIVIFGHSAGGHLVSLLATHDDFAALRPHIRGVVSLSGAYDLNDLTQIFWKSIIEQTFRGGFGNTEQITDASAVTYLDSVQGPPPFHLLYCQLDMPNLADQAQDFDRDLTEHDIAHALSYLPGYDHVSEMAAMADATAAPTRLITDWIEGTLGLRTYLPQVINGH